MRYEHAIKHTQNKYELIEKEANSVYYTITKAHETGELTRTEYENLLVLCKDIVDEISRSTDINERLVEIMGNEILLTAEERGIAKGIEKGIEQSTIVLIKSLMDSYKIPFDEACQTYDKK